MCYREGTYPLSVTYKRASELASGVDVLTVDGGVRIQTQRLSTLRTDAVLVDPEPKAHVRVEQQVADSTAANVGVLVSVAVGELDEHNTKHRADDELSHSVRGAGGDSDEHVLKAVEQ